MTDVPRPARHNCCAAVRDAAVDVASAPLLRRSALVGRSASQTGTTVVPQIFGLTRNSAWQVCLPGSPAHHAFDLIARPRPHVVARPALAGSRSARRSNASPSAHGHA